MKHSIQPVVALLALWLANAWPAAAASYREPWRPQFHFTPATNWMNDPNGMVFYEGEYHLFYQFNPFGDKWGHMSWGHAVSKDLVHWEHLPVALYEENEVMIFSGSAVIDWKNTTGFGKNGKPPMVAIYTGHYTKKPLQNQHLAFSNDKGRTWTKFSGNPVLDIGAKDFRDPKVMWHEPTKRWLMTVAWPNERKVRFYTSPNLKTWSHLSDFGPAGSTTGIWECPDLFPLRVAGQRGVEKWVLIVNVGSGAPAGGSGCQYFIGEFDGNRFTLDATFPRDKGAALWADWGRDFYAAVSWSDVPARDGRRLWLGWMSNWEYANDVPTSPWRSAMSIPRELGLRDTPAGLRLFQQPVRELTKLRGKRHRLTKSTLAEANAWLNELDLKRELLEVAIEFESMPPNGEFGLRIVTAPNEATLLRYEPATDRLTFDRSQSGRVNFHPKFGALHGAPVRRMDGRLRLHLLLDMSSLEVFAADGETVLTELILPAAGPRRLELLDGTASTTPAVRNLEIWELNSAPR